ncbi:MAG: glycosyl transferase family protein [Vibrio sp.]
MSLILECIRTVGRGERGRKPLSFEQAFEVMSTYLQQSDDQEQIGDDQMAMLLMLIRVNNETPEEIAGFIKAFQSQMPKIKADIDWPCYAGKRGEEPWHGLAAKILADQGYKVLIHGDLDAKGKREHIAGYLSLFDIKTASSMQDAERLLIAHNIAYLPLDVFAPKALKMLQWKHRYGLRTPINTMARGLNPAAADIGIRGSFHPGYGELHARVDQLVDSESLNVVSFKGQHGEAEYNPNVSQSIWLSTSDGVRDFYLAENKQDDLMLPKQPIFQGDAKTQLHIANVVVSTLTAVLFAKYQDYNQAFEQAMDYWRQYCQQSN